ncbi:MAG TPA: hypothetical protein VG370_22680 [Chloroflexota bacterium]|jgi:hypothetical protein|nr:hypothetical protein [Chloroflexota bacterium]
MDSRRAALLGGPAAGFVSPAESPTWQDLLARVEVLLATLREQVTEIDARDASTPGDRNLVARDHLIHDIDAARSAVKHARRRVAGFRAGAARRGPKPVRPSR